MSQKHEKLGTGLIRDKYKEKQEIEKSRKLKRELGIEALSTELLPPKVDLRIYMPRIYSQGEYGTCVAWATAALREYYIVRSSGQTPDKISRISPMFIYTYPNGRDAKQGMSLVDGINTLLDVGAIDAYSFPYPTSFQSGRVAGPTQEQISEALKYKMDFFTTENAEGQTRYYRTITYGTVAELKQALYEERPAVIGIDLWDCFDATPYEGENIGLIPTPDPSKNVQTNIGHAMLVVGYDDTKHGGVFIIRNSWGESKGDKGYYYLKYSDCDIYNNSFFEDQNELFALGLYSHASNLAKPVPPQNVSLTGSLNASGKPEIIITSAGHTSKTLYRDGSPIGSNPASPYVDSNATSGDHYYYLKATNSVGSTLSKVLNKLGLGVNNGDVKITVPSTVTIGTPTLTVGSPTPSSLTLTMSASNATGFDVWRSTSASGPFTQVNGSSVTSPWTDTGLSGGTTYYYYVKGRNGSNVGPQSLTQSGTTLQTPGSSFSNPIVLSGTSANGTLTAGGAVYFKYTASQVGTYVFTTSSSIDLKMDLYSASNSSSSLATDDDGGGSSQPKISYNNGTANNQYVLKVYGYSSSVQGSFTLNVTPPAAPAPTISISKGTVTSNQVTINISATNCTTMNVYRNGASYKTGLAYSTSWQDTVVTPGTTYSYYIVGKNSQGVSVTSNTLSITVPSTSVTPTTILEDFEDTTYNFNFSGDWTRSTTNASTGTGSYKCRGVNTTAPTSETSFSVNVPTGATTKRLSFDYKIYTTRAKLEVFLNTNTTPSFSVTNVSAFTSKTIDLPTTGTNTIKFRVTYTDTATAYTSYCYIDNVKVEWS